MASANFTNLTDHLARAGVQFATDSFKFLLVASLPSEGNLDSWVNRSDVTGEATGTGYTAGGVAVTVTVGSVDTTNNRTPVTLTNLAPGWTTSSISAVGGILYKNSGSAATDKLVSLVDFGGTVTSTLSNYNVTFTTPLYINR
jgi:flagellar basal body rod protein FlgG